MGGDMRKIKRFEDIQAWQKARKLVNEIYSITGGGLFESDNRLSDRLRTSSVSIMMNIAEGFARKTNNEFLEHLILARVSTAEVQTAIYIAYDQNYINREQYENLYRMADETVRLTTRISKNLKEGES